MFRLILVLRNPERGIEVKLRGKVRADRATGRLTTAFQDNPQLPVSSITLSLNGGPRAPLANPNACGPQRVSARLAGWSGRDVTIDDTFTLDCFSGLGAFTPSVAAGTANPVGGAASPFALRITKPDGNAAIAGIGLTLPTGLLARVAGTSERRSARSPRTPARERSAAAAGHRAPRGTIRRRPVLAEGGRAGQSGPVRPGHGGRSSEDLRRSDQRTGDGRVRIRCPRSSAGFRCGCSGWRCRSTSQGSWSTRPRAHRRPSADRWPR